MSIERKAKALTRMLNGFPQTTENYVLLLDSYTRLLSQISEEAVERAVERFLTGIVPDQSRKFAPSVPEFVQEAKECEDFLRLMAKPKLPSPPRYSDGTLPFERARNKALADHAHLPVLFENIDRATFQRMSATRQIPVGAKWVASLGIVYGTAGASA